MRIDVEIRVETAAGCLADGAEPGIRARLEERFASMTKGETVFRSTLLGAVQGVEGVVRAELVRPREDVRVPAGEAAVLGRFSVAMGIMDGGEA